MDKIYYTVQEVAQLLKLSSLTIYKYIRERKLNVIDLGGQYRIEKSELLHFLDDHRFIPKEDIHE